MSEQAVEEFTDVEEVEELPEDTAVEDTAEPAKAEDKKSKRAKLPEGYCTPIEFKNALQARLREEGTLGADEEFKPQVVYSYIRNKSKVDPIPVTYVDTEGNEYEEDAEGRRPAFRLNAEGYPEEAMAWWDRKEERKVQRAANAKAKAEKKTAPKKDDTAGAEVLTVDADEDVEVEEAE